jgi:hypothetical protein
VSCTYTDTPNRRLLYLYPDGHDAEPLQMRVDVLTTCTPTAGSLVCALAMYGYLFPNWLSSSASTSRASILPGALRYEMRDTIGAPVSASR